MTKLKTLKELNIHPICIAERKYVYIAELRQEAINWIKEIRRLQLEHAEFVIKHIIFNYSKEREDWIKLFFNISEEDLK